MPGSNFLIDLIKKIKEPIISTSVNISSHSNLNSALDIEHYFKDKNNQPDLIINSDSGAYKSSRIINITDINNPIILRK
jgi:tRNA A37 threonylcarbamoyladenosine synthetase subunit TsaC/SUA5/YrdC